MYHSQFEQSAGHKGDQYLTFIDMNWTWTHTVCAVSFNYAWPYGGNFEWNNKNDWYVWGLFSHCESNEFLLTKNCIWDYNWKLNCFQARLRSSNFFKNTAALWIKITTCLDPPPSIPFLPDCWVSIISLGGDRYVAARSNSLSKKREAAEHSLLATATRQGRHSVISRPSYNDTASPCCACCEHGWSPRAVGVGEGGLGKEGWKDGMRGFGAQPRFERPSFFFKGSQFFFFLFAIPPTNSSFLFKCVLFFSPLYFSFDLKSKDQNSFALASQCLPSCVFDVQWPPHELLFSVDLRGSYKLAQERPKLLF